MTTEKKEVRIVSETPVVVDSWGEWSKHVLKEIERQAKTIEDLVKQNSSLENVMVRLETRLTDVLVNFSECRNNCNGVNNVLVKKIDTLTEIISTLSTKVSNIEENVDSLGDVIYGSNNRPGLKSSFFVLQEKMEKIQYMVYGIYGFLSALSLSVLVYIINTKLFS